jgi:hypothetical protein
MLEYLAHREQVRLWRHYRYLLSCYCDHPIPSYYYLTEGFQYHEGEKVVWVAVTNNKAATVVIDYNGQLRFSISSHHWRGVVHGRALRCNFDDQSNLHVLTEDYKRYKLLWYTYRPPLLHYCYGKVEDVKAYFRPKIIGPLPERFYQVTNDFLRTLLPVLRPEHWVLYPELLLQRLSEELLRLQPCSKGEISYRTITCYEAYVQELVQ